MVTGEGLRERDFSGVPRIFTRETLESRTICIEEFLRDAIAWYLPNSHRFGPQATYRATQPGTDARVLIDVHGDDRQVDITRISLHAPTPDLRGLLRESDGYLSARFSPDLQPYMRPQGLRQRLLRSGRRLTRGSLSLHFVTDVEPPLLHSAHLAKGAIRKGSARLREVDLDEEELSILHCAQEIRITDSASADGLERTIVDQRTLRRTGENDYMLSAEIVAYPRGGLPLASFIRYDGLFDLVRHNFSGDVYAHSGIGSAGGSTDA